MILKQIESEIILYVTPPDFKEFNEETQYYFREQMRKAMGNFIPIERVNIKGSKHFYLRVKKPEYWDFKITLSNNGEQALKILFYEGFK